MYAEKYHYYNNRTGAGYHNHQVMITTTNNGKLLQVTELLANYDDEIIHISVNHDVEYILHRVETGDLEPSTPDSFIRLLMLVPDKIELRQDLYDKGLSLQQDYSLAP